MSQQIFTLQELKRAWRGMRAASIQIHRQNAHRLLLAYSIECGLKAVWLKNECRTLFTSVDIRKTGHDLNEVMKNLRVSHRLPEPLSMSDVKDERKTLMARRNIRIGDLHQVWRYGGALIDPPADDTSIEASLEKIHNWIEKELE